MHADTIGPITCKQWHAYNGSIRKDWTRIGQCPVVTYCIYNALLTTTYHQSSYLWTQNTGMLTNRNRRMREVRMRLIRRIRPWSCSSSLLKFRGISSLSTTPLTNRSHLGSRWSALFIIKTWWGKKTINQDDPILWQEYRELSIKDNLSATQAKKKYIITSKRHRN